MGSSGALATGESSSLLGPSAGERGRVTLSVIGALRDYQEWHRAYEDPSSSLSWRLGAVQASIRQALNDHPGAIRALSLCAGDGRDILGVLDGRADAQRVTATLIEIHPEIAADAVRRAGATSAVVDVRIADAGCTDAYRDAVPAELVLLVGIFGNITQTDIETTVRAAPQLCAPGATLVWSRGRDGEDLNPTIRGWFTVAGFTELDYFTLERGSRPAVGVVRYDGTPHPLAHARRLFTFQR